MAGLLTPGGFNYGAFGGDALSGLGAGLLAYGAGGPLRNQAALIGLQGMQQAQQSRAEQQQRALQNQSLTQQLAMQQQQMSRQATADDLAAKQRQMYQGLLGGQPVQGPTQSGAPLDMKSPVNPALANLPPMLQQSLPLMDPEQGIGILAQMATKKPAIPNLVTWRDGDQTVSGYLDANGTKHEVSRGAAFPPQQPQQLPSDIQEYNLAKTQGFKGSILDYQTAKKGQGFTTTLPDGTVISMGGAQKSVTEAQSTAGTRASMIKDGVTKMISLYNNPNVSLPRMVGADVLDNLVSPVAGNLLRSGEEQQFNAAKSSALEGLASAVTGAGVAKDQFKRYENMLPSITDKDPNVKAFKLKLANDFLKQQLIAAGPAGKDLAGAIDAGVAEASAPKQPTTQQPAQTSGQTPLILKTYDPTTGAIK